MNQVQTKRWQANSDDEDDMDIREPWMWGGKKAYIFLVDVTENMFEKDVEDKTYIQMAFKAFNTIMKQDVQMKRQDLHGIVLYGTKHKDQKAQANHITTLQELALPNADRIKELINITEDIDDFEKQHGHSNDFSLAEALRHCVQMASNCTTKIYKHTILLMTCNDNPHSADPHLQHAARTQARDLNQLNMSLEILPFGKTFEPDRFFKEVRQLSHGDDADTTDIKIMNELEDIVSFMETSIYKRSSARVLWSLGEGVKLGVATYSYIKSVAPFPKMVKMERSKNSLVTSHVQVFNADTGEEVHKGEISKAVTLGGQTIQFEPEELNKAKYISKPGLVLLGFKPIETIELWHQIKHSLHVYPEERLVKGSRTLFAALHQRCIARNVVPICYFTARQGGKPKLVALLPKDENLDAGGAQLDPPGFLLRYLPYADTIRDLKDQQVKCPYPEPELVKLAEKVIDKTKFKFNPRSIDNPKLRKHWAGIEALALGYDDPKEVDDLTLPDYRTMDDRAGDLAQQFMDMAFPGGFCEETLKQAAKRAAPAKPPAAKRAKPDLDNTDVEDVAKQGLVEKLKVDQLKEYLTSVGVRVSKMKKAELVEAVYAHLNIDQPS